MDIVVGFQSGANRVQKDGGEVEYGREFLKVNDNAVYGREYVRYRNSNNQLTDEIKTDYKVQEGNAKALENIVNGQRPAISQENSLQAEEKPEALKTVDANLASNNGNSNGEGSE